MNAYPINLRLEGRRCAVLGGGQVAQRKLAVLLDSGADITVISPAVTPLVAGWVAAGHISQISSIYSPGLLAGFFLVICATSDYLVNRTAALEARRSGALVNVIDDPELCDFTVPAQVAQGDLLITVSTGGKSPAMARRLREELARQYGPEYGTYLDLIGRIRQDVRKQLSSSREREVFWQESLTAEIFTLLRQGDLKKAEEKIRNAIGCAGTQS